MLRIENVDITHVMNGYQREDESELKNANDKEIVQNRQLVNDYSNPDQVSMEKNTDEKGNSLIMEAVQTANGAEV